MPKSKRPKLLSSTRPSPRPPLPASSTTTPSRPTTIGTTATLSSKRTRSLIRTHHTLQKQISQALASNDVVKAEVLRREMERNGGLGGYQAASTAGQRGERGGDTSRVAVGWLREGGLLDPTTGASTQPTTIPRGRTQPLRVLEIGALSPTNAITIPHTTLVRRIDLRSTHPLIEEKDFMTLDPHEEWEGEVGYDIVSLSLVVNFVGDASERGEMLRWSVGFLRGGREGECAKGTKDGGEGAVGVGADERMGEDDGRAGHDDSADDQEVAIYRGTKADDTGTEDANANDGTDHDVRNNDDGDTANDYDNGDDNINNNNEDTTTTKPLLPALFLVLPLPCLANSRYLTEPHLTAIMSSLGYTLTRVKRSSKLFYSLWWFASPLEGSDGGDGVDDGVDDGKGKGSGKRKSERDGKREAETGERKRHGGENGRRVFKKVELRKGRDRNNFCIVLDDKN